MAPPIPARILLAEDDYAVRTFAERALRRAGYEVVIAVDGEEALRCAELGPFDVYVLDVVMPRMRGDVVAEQVRRIRPDARVLFFTGYAEPCASTGSVVCLAKPVTVARLLNAVASLLGDPTDPA